MGDKMILVKSDKPYPKPRVEKKNLEYAKILLQDYSGNISENTASHLYIYQHFISKNSSFKEIIKKISIVEMTHLELLAETIKLLGMNPEFKTINSINDTLIPWTSDNINYETNFKKMLDIDIASETAAIKSYKLHIKEIDDKYIKELLNRIIEDEVIHLKIFEDYKKKNNDFFE
jgi:bacterioferritin